MEPSAQFLHLQHSPGHSRYRSPWRKTVAIEDNRRRKPVRLSPRLRSRAAETRTTSPSGHRPLHSAIRGYTRPPARWASAQRPRARRWMWRPPTPRERRPSRETRRLLPALRTASSESLTAPQLPQGRWRRELPAPPTAPAATRRGRLGRYCNPSGVGVFGQALATTSSGQRGVQGTAYGPGGVGVRGDATGNTANSSAGVVAVANGPIDTGLSAYATSTTGYTYGVLAIDDSATGIGGFFIATSTTGSPSGIVVYDYSATGTAGSFNSVAGGNILIGQNNGANVFRVDGTGKGYFDGGTTTGGADFAESVAVRGDHVRYEPGDLLALDPTGNRRLERSQDAYSTRVAGIYSTKPGILATTHAMDDSRLAGEVPLAVMGIVPCKVTAENGAIGVGDLLVASSHVGYAMKGTDRGRMLGAVVGKAMEPLADGSGVIQVLVTLQ